MERGQIVALATSVIPPENTPQKTRGETLIAHPRWKYVGPRDTIRFEWQIGRWGAFGFAGDSARKYATSSQPASAELKEFNAALPAISLSPLSPGYYDCEIWFKDKFSDLRVIVENCVRIVEEAPPPEKYSLEIAVEPPGSGNVTVSPIMAVYPAGTSVSLHAMRVVGYEFDHWGGDVYGMGSQNPITVTMDSDKWVVAVFKSIAKYAIDGVSIPASGGYWYMEPYKDLYDRLDVVKLTAFAYAGYSFDYWMINDRKRTYNPASVIVMDKDVWIECHFRRL